MFRRKKVGTCSSGGRKKKTGVAEHPWVFRHAGLPINKPPGGARLPFSRSSEQERTPELKLAHRPSVQLESLYAVQQEKQETKAISVPILRDTKTAPRCIDPISKGQADLSQSALGVSAKAGGPEAENHHKSRKSPRNRLSDRNPNPRKTITTTAWVVANAAPVCPGAISISAGTFEKAVRSTQRR